MTGRADKIGDETVVFIPLTKTEGPDYSVREPIELADQSEAVVLRSDITDSIGRIGIEALREVHMLTQMLLAERPHGHQGVERG